MLTIEGLLASLDLEPAGEDRYVAQNAEPGHGVVFGGQLLAQSIVAALRYEPEKRVKTVHSVFPRAGSTEAPLDVAVERVHSGRAMASTTVTFTQGGKVIARSQVLLSADEPDFIHHADAAPLRPGPDAAAPPSTEGAWEVRLVGDVDIHDPAVVGPPELDVWTRFAGAPDEPGVAEALLAYATDGFLIATAMRPHEGVGQSLAHVTLSTGVLSHTITFHEPFSASEWFLLAHHSSHAGHGRCYGQANVFLEDGTHVASFVQDAMIRPMQQGSKL